MTRYRTLWDHAGIAVSTACMLHCIALPLVLVLLPGLAAVVPASHSVHAALVVALVAVAGAAFVPGYRRHRRPAVVALAVTGLALVAGGALAHAIGELAETMLTVAGSGFLVSAHLLNRSACARCGQPVPVAGPAPG
jgi:hypothetical protein